ncbi:MAG: Na+/H+ antiporter NhaC family protein [Brevinema sp.]
MKADFRGIIPFIVFIGIYFGTGLFLQSQQVEMAFYQLPAPIAAFCGIITAFLIFKDSFSKKLHNFLTGCGQEEIMIMCMIYLLTGAFANISKQMGGIDATVNLGITYIPSQFIAVGVFILGAFISTATGTSVGAIVALGPIAVGLAEKSGVLLPLVLASLMGGAMFGDNLSMISDTTIASTRTQGVNMKDKFRVNLALVVPSAIITIILLLVFGSHRETIPIETTPVEFLKVFPYLLVLGLALSGVNVFVVLLTGIFSSGAIGFYYQEFTLLQYANHIYNGFTNMNEIFILSILTGGLAQMVIHAGGIQWILEQIQKFIKGTKTAQLGIAGLISLTDIAVANNTIAILINGSIAKEISTKYQVDPRRTATLLDVFSCIFQGAIPYGAQMLILLQFTGNVDYSQVFPYLWYQGLLFIITILSIYIPFADRYIKNNPIQS